MRPICEAFGGHATCGSRSNDYSVVFDGSLVHGYWCEFKAR